MATDPICGMTVDPKSADGTHEHNGQTYYFCSQHCVTQFKKDPARFVKPATPAHTAAVEQSRGQNESVIDPVCGMNVLLLQPTLPREVCGRTQQVS
jgi:Cu+-exporting ATPase